MHNSTARLIFMLALVLLAGCSSTELAHDPQKQISLREIAEDLGAVYYMDDETGKGVVATTSWRLVALPELDRILIDGSELQLTEPVMQFEDELYLSRDFYENHLRPLARAHGGLGEALRGRRPAKAERAPARKTSPPARSPLGNLSGWTITVDAGHGGRDHGARVGGVLEKHINLRLSLDLAGSLRQAGARVVMTRTSDRYVSLDRRVDISHQQGSDFFVSIHANSCPDSHVRGVEVFVKSKPAGATVVRRSRQLAGLIARAIAGATGTPNRGVKYNRRNLRVLRKSRVPAVLVEVGFLTNHSERAQLVDRGYQQTLANSLWRGIRGYVQARGGRRGAYGE